MIERSEGSMLSLLPYVWKERIIGKRIPAVSDITSIYK